MLQGRHAISRHVCRWLGASLLGGLAACSGGPADHSSTDPVASANPSNPGPEATLSVRGVLHGIDGSAISGVTVCLRVDPLTAGQGPCTTSDGGGAWTIAKVLANARVAITFEKAAFVPTLRAVSTGTGDMAIPDEEGVLETPEAFVLRTGGSLDGTSGSLAFSTAASGSTQAVAATATLRAIDGAFDVSPHYDNEPLDASAGTSGIFTRLPDGYYMLMLGDASVPCASSGGLYGYPVTLYAPPGELRVLVPVVAGFVTTPVTAACAVGAAPVAVE